MENLKGAGFLEESVPVMTVVAVSNKMKVKLSSKLGEMMMISPLMLMGKANRGY